MSDIVLIPTYNRPHYLALCLEHIVNADGGTDKQVMVSHDYCRGEYHYTNVAHDIVKQFKWHHNLNVSIHVCAAHNQVGNLVNILSLYREGYQAAMQIGRQETRYVYLIEDDVLVGKDFFTWHEAIHRQEPKLFCSVGWHCIRTNKAIKNNNPNEYIKSQCDFSSIGVCWPKRNVVHIAGHACLAYYNNPPEYLAQAFPHSSIPPGKWTEQAGLIMRLLEQGNRYVAWPTYRRCSHIGISGYHRPHGFDPTGTLEQRISKLRDLVQGNGIVAASAGMDDIEPIPEYKPCTELKLVQTL